MRGFPVGYLKEVEEPLRARHWSREATLLVYFVASHAGEFRLSPPLWGGTEYEGFWETALLPIS